MRSRKWRVALCGLCLTAVTASAEWERTVSAWDSKLPDQGRFQLSLWGGYWEWESDGADGKDMDATLYLNYGIADNWSVALAPSYFKWDQDRGGDEAGISDTEVLSTYRLVNEADAGFDLAMMGRVSLPTGDDDKGLGTGNVEPGASVILSKTLGPIIAVANLGGTLILDADGGEEDYMLGAVFEGIYPVSEQWSVNGQLAASTARWEHGDESVDLGAGVRFTPVSQWFLVGAGYVCLTDAYDWGLQVASGYEF